MSLNTLAPGELSIQKIVTVVRQLVRYVQSLQGDIRIAKTANYTLANGDKAATIALGGSAFYTLTVNAATGYDADFSVAILNEDTGLNGTTARGKLIAINGYTSFVLWPGQMFTLANQNNWWQFNAPGRWNAPGSVTLNVNHASGSDTNNDGLSSGSGSFATIYNAYLVAQTSINVGPGGTLTIQNVNETFTESPAGAFLGPSLQGGSGGGVVFIKGNEASPTSCVWNTAGIVVNDGGVVSLRGFKMLDVSTGHNAVTADKMGLIVFANMEFGAFTGGAHLVTSNGGVLIYEGGTYTVSGNCNFHLFNLGGSITIFSAAVSVPNALTFTAWYDGQGSGSAGTFSSTTFSGTGSGAGSTGKKYSVNANASLILNGATLPGATAGTTATGGQAI